MIDCIVFAAEANYVVFDLTGARSAEPLVYAIDANTECTGW